MLFYDFLLQVDFTVKPGMSTPVPVQSDLELTDPIVLQLIPHFSGETTFPF